MATFLMSSMTLLGLKRWQWQSTELQHMLLGYTSLMILRTHMYSRNTCAHEQNVVSTAKALPRTAADISNTISVLFVGPSKDVPKSMLKNVFQIQKTKVHSFLKWLRFNHQMNSHFDIHFSSLDPYKHDV